MQKIVQVHCLSVDKPILEGKLLSLTSNNQIYYLDGQGSGIKMFLYFTSEEEIKEGDWFIANQAPRKCIKVKEGTYPFVTLQDGKEVSHFKTWKTKIVATTNPELWLEGRANYKTQLLIPKIPLSFIKEYVEKQGNVKEVSLEQLRGSDGYYDKNEVWHWKILGLKLDPQGCVIVSPIEEKIDWEQVFDNAQSMHLQEFINHYTEKVFKHQEGA